MYSEDEARALLEPYSSRLYQCVVRGIREYQTQYVSLRVIVTRRSDSSIRCDLIWHELIKEFEDEAGLSFSNKRNRQLMHINNCFNLRVKKLDSRMRPQNNMTQSALNFLEQKVYQLRFPGMEPPTNVDVAYQLTGVAEDQVSVYLRCPDGRRNHEWIWQLDEARDVPEDEIITTIQADKLGSQRRVRVRSEKAASVEEDSSGS